MVNKVSCIWSCSFLEYALWCVPCLWLLSREVSSASFVTSWTVAHPAPLSMGFFQARILERVATPSSRRSSQPRDRTRISCTGRQILCPWDTKKAPYEVWSVLLEQNWFFKKRVFIYQSQTPSLSHFLPVPLATISHVYESACVLYID